MIVKSTTRKTRNPARTPIPKLLFFGMTKTDAAPSNTIASRRFEYRRDRAPKVFACSLKKAIRLSYPSVGDAIFPDSIILWRNPENCSSSAEVHFEPSLSCDNAPRKIREAFGLYLKSELDETPSRRINRPEKLLFDRLCRLRVAFGEVFLNL